VPREPDRTIARRAAGVARRLTGLVFPGARQETLSAAVARGVQRTGATDLDSYLARLEVEPRLLDDLVAEITVGETYFFRDPEQFAVIRDHIIPTLVHGSAGGTLRVWSAGCASGEEAYTVAILLEQRGLLSLASIVGTDLSRRALARAVRARYGRWSLRGVTQDVTDNYFERSGGDFELVETVRRSVEFRYLNLAADAYPSLVTGISGMDLILCRNVLIYFDPDTTKRVAERLVASLSPEGWLVTGASDPPLGDLVPCEVVVTDAGLAYRRPGKRRARVDAVATARPRAQPGPPTPRAPSPPPAPRPPEEMRAARESHPRRPGHARASGEELERAVRAYHAREYAEAAEVAGRLTEDPGAGPTAWIIAVRSYANQGALEEAGRACAAGLDRHRMSAELAYLHGLLILESGRSLEAVAALRRALYLDRGLAVAHLALANALTRSGDTQGARRALTNAERLLCRMPSDAKVPASDGGRAGRLAEAARAQLTLLCAGEV
jgi:chemotaxis protein methyltransferase CheR